MLTSEQTERQSNIELLRIIGMLIMIGNHFISGSGLATCFNFSVFSWRMFFFQCVGVWGKTLVNSFVLITGYFMCEKSLSVGQWIKLFMKGKIYATLIWLLLIILELEIFTLEGAYQILFAEILYTNQGFTASFVLFYLLIPFCNKLLHAIDKQQLRIIILLGMIIYAIPAWIGNKSAFSYVGWYAIMYFTGAYIRLYEPSWMKNNFLVGGVLLCSFILAFLSIAIIDIIGPQNNFYEWYYLIKDNSSKPFAIIIGAFLFLFFKNLKIPNNPKINKIAATTYGILWFHTANPIWRDIIWNRVFRVKEIYYFTWWKIPILFCIIIIIVFIVGCIVDLLYTKYIEKPILNQLRKYKWYYRNLWE